MNNENNKHEVLRQYIQSQKALKEQIEKDLKEATQKIGNKLIKEAGSKSGLFWKIRKQIFKQKPQNTYDTITEEGE